MSFTSLSRRARRALVALAVALPALSIATLAGGAAWLNAHGGLAAPLSSFVRQAVFLAGASTPLPATLTAAQAATLGEAGGGTWVADDDGPRGDFSFALIEPDDRASVVFDVDHDSARLRRLRDSARVPTLWFSEDGVETVITDPAAVARARELCAPLQRIGREMGRVGGEMGRQGDALGRQGAELGRFGGRLGELGGRLGGITARLASTRRSGAAYDRLRDEREQIRAEMEQVRAEMDRVRSRMDSEEGGTVRARQRKLSLQMRELSRQHEAALDRARAGLRQLLREERGARRSARPGRSI